MSDAEAKSRIETTDYIKTVHAIMSSSPSSVLLPEEGLQKPLLRLDEFMAEQSWLHSMMLEPKSPAFWNSFALVYMMNGDLASAEEAIDRSLEIDTSISWTWRIWGDLFLRSGQNSEAERAYRMSLELEPWDTQALYQLSILYMNRGAYPEAASLLGKLLLVVPNNQELWDYLTVCLTNLP